MNHYKPNFDKEFPIINTNVISLSDGQTQYLLPESVVLPVRFEKEDEYFNMSLGELYAKSVQHFFTKGITKVLMMSIIERLENFDLPWTEDKEIFIGNLMIKL